jgi:adenosylcobinamide-phosphate synthase
MLRDHRLTESPNAGWTMSAMAGALNVMLEKKGYYVLGDKIDELKLSSITQSQRILLASAACCILVVTGVEVAIHATS